MINLRKYGGYALATLAAIGFVATAPLWYPPLGALAIWLYLHPVVPLTTGAIATYSLANRRLNPSTV